MNAGVIAEESRLALSVAIGRGPKKVIELNKKDLHPALTFAHRRTNASAEVEIASYRAVRQRLVGGRVPGAPGDGLARGRASEARAGTRPISGAFCARGAIRA